VNPGTDWAEQTRRLVETLRGSLAAAAGDAGGDAAAAGEDCRWCPLCRLIAVLRGERPEVTAVIAEVLRATADALQATAAAPQRPRADRPAAEEEPAAPPVGDPPPAVQRIEIA
jgi:hypothetical protein